MGSQRRIPALAAWLLNRVSGPGSTVESLVGDIVEEYQRGRSVLWLWTQLLAALALSARQDMRAHKLAAVSGGLTGLASLWGFSVLSTLLLTSIGFPHAVGWRWQHRVVLLGAGFASAVVSAWIVGRVHRMSRVAAVFGFLASVFIVLVIELPLLYWFAPSVFFVTVVPLLPMALTSTAVLAPVAILMGGFWDPPRRQSPQSPH